MTSSSYCENFALIVLLFLRWEFFKWSISTSYSYCRILNIYKYTIWLRFCVNVIKATGIIPMSLLENFFLLLFRTSIALRPSNVTGNVFPATLCHIQKILKFFLSFTYFMAQLNHTAPSFINPLRHLPQPFPFCMTSLSTFVTISIADIFVIIIFCSDVVLVVHLAFVFLITF